MTTETMHKAGVAALRTLVDEVEALCKATLPRDAEGLSWREITDRLSSMDKLVKKIRKAEANR